MLLATLVRALRGQLLRQHFPEGRCLEGWASPAFTHRDHQSAISEAVWVDDQVRVRRGIVSAVPDTVPEGQWVVQALLTRDPAAIGPSRSFHGMAALRRGTCAAPCRTEVHAGTPQDIKQARLGRYRLGDVLCTRESLPSSCGTITRAYTCIPLSVPWVDAWAYCTHDMAEAAASAENCASLTITRAQV